MIDRPSRIFIEAKLGQLKSEILATQAGLRRCEQRVAYELHALRDMILGRIKTQAEHFEKKLTKIQLEVEEGSGVCPLESLRLHDQLLEVVQTKRPWPPG